MKKQAYTWFALSTLLALLLAACGNAVAPAGQSQSQPVSQVSPTTGHQLYVLNGGSASAQHIVDVQLGATSPTVRLTLPAGPTDLKHQRVYVALPQAGNQTVISVYDTRSGACLHKFTIAGTYVTAAQANADAMLSGDGRWLALRAQNTPTGTTDIALVDTQSGKLTRIIHLAGSFTLDAVSPQGTMLYLLEYYQGSHYNVRAYDLRASRLLEGNIADKNDLDEKMEGAFLARQMSDDGDIAYTLYINTETNDAFIHLLWLPDSTNGTPFPMLARCIDLPVGKSAALLRYYTLTLSRDGKTLYAVNAALGLVATVNLDPGVSSYQLWLIPSARVTHFTPDQSTLTSADRARNLYAAAVLAPDQSRLYVAGPRGIWVINTATLKVQGHYLKGQSFTGLGISSDGQTLYAVNPVSGITLLKPASGQVLTTYQGSIPAPWGIAWATD